MFTGGSIFLQATFLKEIACSPCRNVCGFARSPACFFPLPGSLSPSRNRRFSARAPSFLQPHSETIRLFPWRVTRSFYRTATWFRQQLFRFAKHDTEYSLIILYGWTCESPLNETRPLRCKQHCARATASANLLFIGSRAASIRIVCIRRSNFSPGNPRFRISHPSRSTGRKSTRPCFDHLDFQTRSSCSGEGRNYRGPRRTWCVQDEMPVRASVKIVRFNAPLRESGRSSKKMAPDTFFGYSVSGADFLIPRIASRVSPSNFGIAATMCIIPVRNLLVGLVCRMEILSMLGIRRSTGPLLLALCAAAAAQAQDIEVSVAGGWGRVVQDDSARRDIDWAGASFKTRLGRPELKVDYETFTRTFTNEKERFHLFTAGWMIQSDRRRVQPFFLVGWTLGVQNSTRDLGPTSPPVPRHSRNGVMGLALSGGASLGSRGPFFVRPELRWKLLGAGPISILQPGLSAGWRF